MTPAWLFSKREYKGYNICVESPFEMKRYNDFHQHTMIWKLIEYGFSLSNQSGSRNTSEKVYIFT